MLVRIANNLFWLGRYIKRIEYSSRFMEAEFYSALDAPKTHKKDLALQAILKMTGSEESYFKKQNCINEQSVFFHTILDSDNETSTISALSNARINAKSTRDILPDEIWEKVNSIYLEILSFADSEIQNEIFYKINRSCIDYMLVVQSLIDSLITREEKWIFLKVGIHLEASLQMIRILKAKLYEIEDYKLANLPSTIEIYQWTTLSKYYGDIDIFKKPMKSKIIKRMILENMIFNIKSPSSLAYRIKEMSILLELLGSKKGSSVEGCEFLSGKLLSKIKYTKFDEIEDGGVITFLDDVLNEIHLIGDDLEKRYFGYL